MKKKSYIIDRLSIHILFFILAIAVSLFFSCGKSGDTDINTPAYFIRTSDNLIIPDIVALPQYGERKATYYAMGVQKYKAQQVAGNPSLYEWVLVAPEAELFDFTNKKIGSHSAGPSWKLFSGTDSIYAQPFSPAKAATSPDANGIDWLQLMPKTGTTPTGVFAGVTHIQRIATTGGKKPAAAPVSATQTIEVPYTAVYRFSKI